MEENYWEDNRLIQATKKEKEEHLNYEMDMFLETCNQLNFGQKTIFERNLLLESLPAHTRILIEFFYNGKNKKYPNDLVAQDFLPDSINWRNERPLITELLEEAKNKADKQLAHLSLWRVKIERDNKKGWDWNGIKRDMEKIIEKFKTLESAEV
ncbi:hypothetical protein KJ866_01195 [Patescibacteria group bacterium]|nr:hypothetical protein [Patescibacteria group bacterium]